MQHPPSPARFNLLRALRRCCDLVGADRKKRHPDDEERLIPGVLLSPGWEVQYFLLPHGDGIPQPVAAASGRMSAFPGGVVCMPGSGDPASVRRLTVRQLLAEEAGFTPDVWIGGEMPGEAGALTGRNIEGQPAQRRTANANPQTPVIADAKKTRWIALKESMRGLGRKLIRLGHCLRNSRHHLRAKFAQPTDQRLHGRSIQVAFNHDTDNPSVCTEFHGARPLKKRHGTGGAA